MAEVHYPHRIRLRGPWEYEPLARADAGTDPLPPGGRVVMPCRWGEAGLGEFAGRVRFRRRFGYPGRLDPTDRVWLTFAGLAGTGEFRLNGQRLGRRDGAAGPFEFEVTALLQARNELVAEVEASSGNGGLWGEVALEIRCPAFLRGVRFCAIPSGEAGSLEVSGEVVGTAERPLELYVLLDGRTVLYTTVEPLPEGRPFRLATERVGPGAHRARVELIDGAVVWYAVEEVIPPAAGPGPCEEIIA